MGRGHSPPTPHLTEEPGFTGTAVMKLGSFRDGQAVMGHPTLMQMPVPPLQTLPCSGETCQLFLGRAENLRVHSVCLEFISQGPNPSSMYQVPGQSSALETLQPGWCGSAEPKKEKARSSSRLAPMWQLGPFGEKVCSLDSGKKDTRFGGSEGKQPVSLQLWAAGTDSCLGAGPALQWLKYVSHSPLPSACGLGGFPAGRGDTIASPRPWGRAQQCQGAGIKARWAGKGLLQQQHTRE